MDITYLLQDWQFADKKSEAQLYSYCYQQFKAIAQKVKNQHKRNKSTEYQLSIEASCNTTLLVNEAYIRLANSKKIDCSTKTIFFKTFAQIIYTILIDHTRKQRALKREVVPLEKVTADEHLLLDKLIDMQSHLENLKDSFDRQVAVFLLKYACKVPNAEIADMMSISLSSVEKDLFFVKQHLALTFA